MQSHKYKVKKSSKSDYNQLGHLKSNEMQVSVDDPSSLFVRKPVRATLNVRGNPIALMFAKKQIDAAQKKAADKFCYYWDIINIGRNIAIDNTRMKVDCGNYSSGIQINVVQAAKELNKIKALIGIAGYDLLSNVVGRGEIIARLYDKQSKQDYKGKQLRECLDILAVEWNFKNVDKARLHPFST